MTVGAVSRRSFLGASAGIATALWAGPGATRLAAMPRPQRVGPIGALPLRAADDPMFRTLCDAALTAARAAGATYADVRVSYARFREFRYLSEGEHLGVGVRALVNGAWGFASSPYWTVDSAARLGREAVAQAKVNVGGRGVPVELAAAPAATGDWTSSCRIDPMELSVDEAQDWIKGTGAYAQAVIAAKGKGIGGLQLEIDVQRIRWAFASTEGSYVTQTFSYTQPRILFRYRGEETGFDFLSFAQRGWEHVVDNETRLRDALPKAIAEIDEILTLPVKPVDVGRFDAVFDRGAMAGILGATFGAATELDRALGEEANAGGTSYLGPDPFAFLGTPVASSHVTVTANRDEPGALATTRWDLEGVQPDRFTIVRDGMLTDYQTDRSHAPQIGAWYTRQGTTVRSHGCASCSSALDLPLSHTPNLALQPGSGSAEFDDLVAGLKQGVIFRGGRVTMDQENQSGLGALSAAYEIKGGKRTARLANAGFIFRSSELWRNVTALGGASSYRSLPYGYSQKGEPTQGTFYNVGAVPCAVTGIAVIDLLRKA